MEKKKYTIECYYKTGNSFGSHEETTILEVSWDNLDIAKEALKRIKEHWEWYKYEDNKTNYRYFNTDKIVKKPKWHKVKTKWDEHDLLNLPTDGGVDFQFYPPWIGYFETLRGAKIIVANSDMEFII